MGRFNLPRGFGGGIGTHIRVWMLVVGLVPLLVFFLYGYLAVRDALIEASDDHLISVVGARRAQIESWFRERLADLAVIGRSPDCIALVRQALAGEAHAQVCRYLDSFQAGTGDYQALALYDLNWNWIAAQSGAERHRETLADAGLRAALADSGGPIMSSVHEHERLGPGLHFGGQLRSPGEDPVGYVVASVDLSGTFAPIFEDRAGLGRSGYVLLADMNGRLLHADESRAGVPRALDEQILSMARQHETGTVHLEEPPGDTFVGFTVIPGQDWVLVAAMDKREALALLNPLQWGFLVAGLATLLAVVVLSAHTSRRLSAPLTELAAVARRITQGRQFEHVPELQGREVAAVGQAFNEMLDSLEQIQRERIQAGALAELGELSSHVVHEMRNRLSSVKMNLQALWRRVGDEPAYAELAGIALEQVRRTEEALTDLLGFARPVIPSPKPIHLCAFLNELSARFRAEALGKGVELRVEDQTSDGQIHADPRLLEQAVSNLLRNAIEVTPSGGIVTVRAFSPKGRPGILAVEVDDQGPGFGNISPEMLFRPFFTTKERGSGLGLAHVRKIVELHEGTVTAEEVPGGARFRLELPQKDVG